MTAKPCVRTAAEVKSLFNRQRICQRNVADKPNEKNAGRSCVHLPLNRNAISTIKTRLYIGSPEPAAVRIRQSVRSHWAVENPLHWCLDMWFAGDRMCLREQYAAKNMHRLKQLALNLINRDKSVKRRINSKRLMAAGDDEFGSLLPGRGSSCDCPGAIA
ncbi:hypothetical protein C7N83_05255 [Neisseria iguanae]|uniref:Transposase IS4-like domain-containing protein n=1 Tax=Neisseria iguanae TaxID=90242 RepID=A0A2P7U0V2_9NEIS|nr:hypothetical protein C7N83_05255 [Neisseria iguanae]